MRNVTIVVLVLITSCQVSLKPKSGPLIPHSRMTRNARRKVRGRPVVRAVHFVKRVKADRDLVGRMCDGRAVPAGTLARRRLADEVRRVVHAAGSLVAGDLR